MKFALNYSPQAAKLLQSGDIEIDLFKCPDWPDLVAEASALCPAYVHFPLVAGQGNVEKVGLETIADWRSRTVSRYVNTHIAIRREDMTDPDDPEEAVETMLRDIRPLVARFGKANVMAEHIPYPDIPDNKASVVAQPAVIRRVIETADCGLLLDLAHARLTADTLNMDVHEYITRLPVERLCELHVTGVGIGQDGLRQDHLPMTDDDWALLAWALAQIDSGAWAQPWVVSCEYGGIGPMFAWRSDETVIAHDIPRMMDMVRAAQPSPVG
jgi:hypothetical protein